MVQESGWLFASPITVPLLLYLSTRWAVPLVSLQTVRWSKVIVSYTQSPAAPDVLVLVATYIDS